MRNDVKAVWLSVLPLWTSLNYSNILRMTFAKKSNVRFQFRPGTVCATE